MERFLISLLALSFPVAAEYSFPVLERQCRQATAPEQKWLPAEWQKFSGFVRSCQILNNKGAHVVLLLSVSAPMYYRSLPGRNADQVALPKSLLFLPDGSHCGELPYAFPDDPPVEMQVRFTIWRNDFPQRIEIAVKDPTASGNRKLTQNWDPNRRRYRWSGGPI